MKRSGAAATAGATVALTLIIAVVVSPWLMGLIEGRRKDWSELSDIGQAYGGVSAVLSGLALCGIAGSLLLQWRQTHLARVTAVRDRHFELVKLSLDDPDLAWPAIPVEMRMQARRMMTLNLWVAHWAMQWDTGMLTRPALRLLFDDLFREPTAVEWWKHYGADWDSHPDRRRRIFLTVAHEAFFGVTGETPHLPQERSAWGADERRGNDEDLITAGPETPSTESAEGVKS